MEQIIWLAGGVVLLMVMKGGSSKAGYGNYFTGKRNVQISQWDLNDAAIARIFPR